MQARRILSFLFLAFWASAGIRAQQAAGAQAPAKRMVRGVVFDDANGNGRRDAGEAGVAGAAVSDQFAVVRAGVDGGYELAADATARVVFVSVPDGWAASGVFWRALQSDAATQQHDFAVRRIPNTREFTFVHASDTHLDQASLPRIQKLRALVEQQKPAFVLITGDLIRDALRVGEAPARAQYDLLVAELAKFPVPVWTVPGNHEIFGIERHLSLVPTTHPLYGKKMYQHYLGPNYFSFNYGGVHFVGLDTVDVNDLWYYGHVDKAQLGWLERDLAALPQRTPVVTFNHIPFSSSVENLYGYTDEPPAGSTIRIGGRMQFRHVVSNPAEVIAVIRKQHFLEIALGGHFHTRETVAYESQGQRLRFYQTAAVLGNSPVPGLTMISGVTLYQVRSGKVDEGKFLPLD